MKRMTPRVLRTTALVSALALVACSSDDPGGPPAITVSSVTLDLTTATLSIGGSVQFTATARDASGNVVSVTIAWSSSNAAVATVNSTGLVTAVAPGTAEIAATAEGQTGLATITVEVPVASVDVMPVAVSVRAGLTVTLTATPRDAGGNPLTGRTVTWATDNGSVAMVDVASGVVTGVSTGMAMITATSEGQSGTATVTIWVGITGSWEGFVDAPAGMCSLNQSITEDDNTGAITGTADLLAPCAPLALTVTGTNNTGGVADSVELTFEDQNPTSNPPFTFNGNFDGLSMMTGLTNGSGCTDCSTFFMRTSFAPIRGLRAVPRREGAAPVKNSFLPRN